MGHAIRVLFCFPLKLLRLQAVFYTCALSFGLFPPKTIKKAIKAGALRIVLLETYIYICLMWLWSYKHFLNLTFGSDIAAMYVCEKKICDPATGTGFTSSWHSAVLGGAWTQLVDS